MIKKGAEKASFFVWKTLTLYIKNDKINSVGSTEPANYTKKETEVLLVAKACLLQLVNP